MLNAAILNALAELANPPTAGMRQVRIAHHVHGLDGNSLWFPESHRDALQWRVELDNLNYGCESHWLEERIA